MEEFCCLVWTVFAMDEFRANFTNYMVEFVRGGICQLLLATLGCW